MFSLDFDNTHTFWGIFTALGFIVLTTLIKNNLDLLSRKKRRVHRSTIVISILAFISGFHSALAVHISTVIAEAAFSSLMYAELAVFNIAVAVTMLTGVYCAAVFRKELISNPGLSARKHIAEGGSFKLVGLFSLFLSVGFSVPLYLMNLFSSSGQEKDAILLILLIHVTLTFFYILWKTLKCFGLTIRIGCEARLPTKSTPLESMAFNGDGVLINLQASSEPINLRFESLEKDFIALNVHFLTPSYISIVVLKHGLTEKPPELAVEQTQQIAALLHKNIEQAQAILRERQYPLSLPFLDIYTAKQLPSYDESGFSRFHTLRKYIKATYRRVTALAR
ncbi:hypothetical protein [Aliidiomarina soli]|uniref:Uncharacterized protein n=1 Tax=Aliidiomarina soli TaxID=1928574 RepID=A0A432WHU2_9GAMM|nr:hypothetical protein [Aliidiomarina soli]RUO33325.1 hypothetical protein CWE14_08920 [Aliidiomarina soli]